jgi:hypothetical protein
MTWKQASRHLGDEELEFYSLGTASEEVVSRLEEHLLECEDCVRRLEETDSYVKAMAGAARQVREARRVWTFPSARVAWPVAACIAVMAGGLLFRNVSGAILWQGNIAAGDAQVRIAGQKSGAYFLRVYSPARQLLREYSLRIGR